MTAPAVPEPDDLDGCHLGMWDGSRLTADADLPALVLFADIDFTDPDAVEARRLEWQEVLRAS